MAVHPNYDNPRVITISGMTTIARPTVCVGCGHEIDDDLYYALVTGPRDRVDVIALSHVERSDQGPLITGCADVLRDRWFHQLAQCDAGVLEYRQRRRRFFLRDQPLHCGTVVEVLSADGHWQIGRFETTGASTRPTPTIYSRIGGWNSPEVATIVPADAVLRLRPDTRRRP